mgnify:CR=1 FL=1
MNALIEAALGRRPTIVLTFIVLLIAGFYAYVTIPKESNPDINIPVIYVSMSHEGISPDDAERLLIRPMEQELTGIEGVKEMTATGYEGGANVVLEFNAGFDSDKALDDVRLAVDKAKPDLPDETEEPTVSEVNFSLFPALVVVLSGDVPERVLLKLAQDLQDKIEALPQVLEARIAGNREEVMEIVVDPNAVETYGLSGAEIVSFFQRSNRLVASGNMDTGVGRFSVKVPGVFETVEDIRTMPVKTSEDSVVVVDDIADIRFHFKDPNSFAYLDGRRALALEVVKRQGENIIETIESVQQTVAEESKYWPEGVKIDFVRDESVSIRNMLADLQNNVISAVLLVMIVCVAALGLRAATLVGLAIPGAFLSGILFLYGSGLTVNIVVLFALILSVGMLVDGAIVVVEYADRKMSEGMPKKQAYGEAAKRMAWPITASTATTLVAFFPLLFWPGVVGEFMKFMPLTLIAVLSSSLLMALIFVPVLGSLFGKAGLAENPEKMEQLAIAETGDLDTITGMTRYYLKTLKLVLRFPGIVLLLAVGVLIGVQYYYANHGNGVKFFPDVEPDVALVQVRSRGNLSVFENDAIMRKVEQAIFDVKGIRNFYSRTGDAGDGGQSFGAERAADVIGSIQIEFTDWQTRLPATEIMQQIREKTADIPGIIVETQEAEQGPPTGKALQLQIRSHYPALLSPAVEKVLQGVEEIGGFVDIEDSRPLPGIEWELEVDRAQAAKFGLDVSSIGQSVRLVTNGLKISEFRTPSADDEIDVIIRFPADERSLNQLDRLQIETPMGSIPIANFVKRVPKPKTGTVSRADGYRQMTVRADLPEDMNTAAKVKEVQDWLMAQDWDPRLQFVFKGEDEEQKQAQEFLMRAFFVALSMMLIILVTQFNSFYSALLILSAVIMSTIGVMIGLVVTGQPFGIVMTGIGVISLAGIIVNNNIVLIDTFDNLVESGRFTIREAILRTGAQRLRPVLLTAITTVLGLLPMVLQMNIDFFGRDITIGAPSTQWWVDLATAIAFGLVFSTPLTLLVTPAALMFREKASHWRKKISLAPLRLRKKSKTQHGET